MYMGFPDTESECCGIHCRICTQLCNHSLYYIAKTCLLAIAVVRSGTPAGDPGPAAEPDKSAACSPLGRSGRVKSL